MRRKLYERNRKLQNGGKMSFYQNGLDWTPKNISRDGAWLDKYDVPQAQGGYSTGDIASLPGVRKDIPLSKEQLAKNKKEVEERIKVKNAKTLADRKARLAGAEKANAKPYSSIKSFPQQLADETQATGDKFRLFPNDPNSVIDDYLNPGVIIGDLASGVARYPLNMQQGNFGEAAWNIAAPALMGAGEELLKPVIGKITSLIKDKPLYPVLSPTTGLTERATVAAETIKSEGNRIVNRLKSPEGMQRMKQMFKKADPNLTDEQLDYAIKNRLAEIETATNYSWPEMYKEYSDIPALKDMPEFVDENIFPNQNAHFSHSNLDPRAPKFNSAPESMVSGTYSQPQHQMRTYKYEAFVSPHFDPGQIALGKGIEFNKSVAGHETMHALQSRGVSPIDDELRNLTKVNNLADKLWNVLVRVNPELKKDFRYFQRGSNKKEPLPFMEELRTRMLEKGIIADDYEKITAEKLLKTRLGAIGQGGKNFTEGTRLIKFVAPWKYKKLASIMNDAPALVPSVGLGIGAAAATQQKKQGGIIKDNNGYWNPDNWGEPVEIGSNNITMQGVNEPLLGVSDEGDTQMMYPGEDYKFKGKKVTEYPVKKNWLEKYK